MSIEEKTRLIKNKALALGFDACGVSKAENLENERNNLQQWLSNGYHGDMQYMENHFEKRLDPTKLMPGCQSVISVILNYFPSQKIGSSNNYHISKYAYGEDYHFVVKRKLKTLISYIQQEIEACEARAFVDSAPVLDRVWAARSGLGWIGKHSLLINKKLGSFVFIGEILTSLKLKADKPINDYCGSCTRCIDSCPTKAIVAPGIVDGSKCISFYTIEKKGEIDYPDPGKFGSWIFGCDICQDVCPWNHMAKPHSTPQLNPSEWLINADKVDWEKLTREEFNMHFKNSPLKRRKFEGVKGNIGYLRKKLI